MIVTYRDGEPGDGAMLERIFNTSFCDTFGHLYRREDLDLFLGSFGLEQWEAQLGDPAYAFRIAEVDGEAVGYAKLGPMKLPVETDRPAILLDQLYLLSAQKGTGIARELMDWTLAQAARRGAQQLYLTVFTENHRARRFYARYGFEEVGPYTYMVGNHADDDIILRLAL